MGQSNSRRNSYAKKDSQLSSYNFGFDKLHANYDEYYNRLSHHYKKIDAIAFEDLFGDVLCEPLWNFYSNNNQLKEISRNRFITRTPLLFGNNYEHFTRMYSDCEEFLNACFFGAQVKPTTSDRRLMMDIIRQMEGTETGKDGKDGKLIWLQRHCPRLCVPLQVFVINSIVGRFQIQHDFKSDILTPVQMFLLKSSLNPGTFLDVRVTKPENESSINNWTKLYSSIEDGVSIRRFEKKVFDYKKPTINIFKLKDGQVCALALDTEWQHSAMKYGSYYTTYVSLKPNFYRIVSCDSLFSNFLLSSVDKGLSFADELSIKGDLSNLEEIECWGVEEDEVASPMESPAYIDQATALKDHHTHHKQPIPLGLTDVNNRMLFNVGM